MKLHWKNSASFVALLAMGACGSSSSSQEQPAADGAPLPQADAAPISDAAPQRITSLRVVTMNSGTTDGLSHDSQPDDGYDSDDAEISNDHYGDGLAWTSAVEATKTFFTTTDADIVAFQEMFYSPDCADIAPEFHPKFVCDGWTSGDDTVVRTVLGPDYQVMCHPGKSDKCVAVNRRVGSFRGCADDFCLEGLAGSPVSNCGSGARVARGVIDLVDGSSITLVHVHGTSGAKFQDQLCRMQQVEQVFEDLGDGSPGANGDRHVILGDLNTDPGRLNNIDAGAERWNDFVGSDKAFRYISEVGDDVTPTYQSVLNIDHVISDVATGSCVTAGITAGTAPVMDAVYFDHAPVVCELTLP